VKIESHEPLLAYCDGYKMQTVMVNLIRNAVESGHRVHVRTGLRSGEVFVEVADDGPGLTEEARKRLFEPFFTTKPNGTGLGLPTSRRFLEAQGGQLEVASDEGLPGALFRVRLAQPASA
jgi:signal transduction histidine kinase